MFDLGGSSFDPDLWSLVSLAEENYQEIEEMASGIDSSSEEALAEGAATVLSPCCQFAGRVNSASLGGMSELLELALSEEFRKYKSLVFSSSVVGGGSYVSVCNTYFASRELFLANHLLEAFLSFYVLYSALVV